MELNRSSFHAQSESVFLPPVDKFLFILLQCFLGIFESFCFPFPPRAIIRSSQFIQRSSEAWIKKIFRLRSSFDSRRRRRRIERVHLSRSSEKHFRNLQKNGKGGVSAICGLRYYPASIEASSGQDILSARRIPPLFLPRKQRAAAREACSGLVVCLPLTSTLLDKDNAPSLIRFGDNSFRSSSAQGKKSRGRSRFPGTSNRFFSLSLSLLFSNELFAKKWSNTFCATNFFLYAFPRDEETQSVGDAENTVKEGSGRGEGKEGREGVRNENRRTGIQRETGEQWTGCRSVRILSRIHSTM